MIWWLTRAAKWRTGLRWAALESLRQPLQNPMRNEEPCTQAASVYTVDRSLVHRQGGKISGVEGCGLGQRTEEGGLMDVSQVSSSPPCPIFPPSTVFLESPGKREKEMKSWNKGLGLHFFPSLQWKTLSWLGERSL